MFLKRSGQYRVPWTCSLTMFEKLWLIFTKTRVAFMFFSLSHHSVHQLKFSDLFTWSQRFFCLFVFVFNHWQVRSFSPFRTWFCSIWMKTLCSYTLVKFNFAVIGPLGLDADICPMRFPLSGLCTLSRVIQISKSKSSMINMCTTGSVPPTGDHFWGIHLLISCRNYLSVSSVL